MINFRERLKSADIPNSAEFLRNLGIALDKVFVGPRYVCVCITNICNYNCLYCWPQGKWSNIKKRPVFFPLKIFKKLVDDCYELGVEKIVLSGHGEPTLHPDIYKMIDCINRKEIEVGLTTNGSFGRDIKKVLHKIDEFQIDLSAATEKTYQILQCSRPDSFKNLIKNITLLSRIKKIRGSPKINCIYVVTAVNCLEIKKIIELAKAYDFDNIQFKPVFVLPEMKNLVISKDLAVKVNALLAGLLKRRDPFLRRTNLDELHKIVSDIARYGHKYEKLPGLKKDDYVGLKYFEQDINETFQCYAGWLGVTISPGADVYPCSIYGHLVAGNLYRSSFKKIWLSKKFSRIRLKMKYLNIREAYWQRCHICLDIQFFYTMRQRIVRLSNYLSSIQKKP